MRPRPTNRQEAIGSHSITSLASGNSACAASGTRAEHELLFQYKLFQAEEKAEERIEKITIAPLGLSLDYTYDHPLKGNLLSATRSGFSSSDERTAEPRIESYTYYDAEILDPHNMKTRTDPNGNVTRFEYYRSANAPVGLTTFAKVADVGIAAREVIRAVREPEQVSTLFTYDFRREQQIRSVSDPRSGDPGADTPGLNEPAIAAEANTAAPPPTVYTLNAYGAVVQIAAPGRTITKRWCMDTPRGAGCPVGDDVLMWQMTDAEAQVHEYFYDAQGNQTTETISKRDVGVANQANLTDRDGQEILDQVVTIERTYEPSFNQVIAETDAEGNTTFHQIDAPGGLPSLPDGFPPPCATIRGSEFTGKLLGTFDALGNRTCLAYDPKGNLVSQTDAKDRTTTFSDYDVNGNAWKIVDANGRSTNRIFDARGRLEQSSDGYSHHSTYGYDSLDRTIREERLDDPAHGGDGGAPQIVRRTFKPNGEVRTEKDGLDQITEFFYDGMNRLRFREERGVGRANGPAEILTTEYQYDRAGNRVAEVTPRSECPPESSPGPGPHHCTQNIRRDHVLDALNRRTQTTVSGPFGQPKVISSNVQYDLADNVLSETDLHGNTTTYDYDWLYRRVRTTLPFTHRFAGGPFGGQAKIEIAYDRTGHKIAETDANGHETTYAYDAIDRLKTTRDPGYPEVGDEIEYLYDAVGNVEREEHHASGLAIVTTYDRINRPLTVTRSVPLGPPSAARAAYMTTYDYQRADTDNQQGDPDNAVLVTDPNGHVTRIDRDGLDRVFETKVDDGGLELVIHNAYDRNGNLASVSDAQGGDVDVVHEYDGLGRKFRSTYVEASQETERPNEEVIYDGAGNRRAVQRPARHRYESDLRQSRSATDADAGGEHHEQRLRADRGGVRLRRRQQQRDGESARQNSTTKIFDSLGRVHQIDDPDPVYRRPGCEIFEYDGVKLRCETDKRNQKTEFYYDPLERLVATNEFDADGQPRTSTAVAYADASNQVVSTDRRNIDTIEQRDALGRLIERRRSGLDLAAALRAVHAEQGRAGCGGARTPRVRRQRQPDAARRRTGQPGQARIRRRRPARAPDRRLCARRLLRRRRTRMTAQAT